MPESNALFESNANATLERVTAIFCQRGGEYGDTWRNAQWLALRAVIRRFGLKIPESALRPMAAAVMYDVKYQRLEGGYKDDSIVDGIAYAANLAEEMRGFEDMINAPTACAHQFIDGQCVKCSEEEPNGN